MLDTDLPEAMPVDYITVTDRLRQVNNAQVDKLADSMKEIGLQTPLTVRSVNDGEFVYLVAGRHRLEAAKRLGWDKVTVCFVSGTDDEFRLWEIAENLHRAELTVAERSQHIAEWVRLTDKPIPKAADHVRVLAQPEPKLSQRGRGGEGRPESGMRAASRKLGLERNEVQRAVKIDAIIPEAKQAARDAGIDDNQSALLKVAAAPPERQVEVVKEVSAKPLKDASVDDKEREAAAVAVTFLRDRLGDDFDEFLDLMCKANQAKFREELFRFS